MYCGHAIVTAGISEWLSSGRNAWAIIAASIIAGLIAIVLPDIPSLIFGVLALSGFLLVANHVAPAMLRGNWGQLGLAILAIGLAVYVSGWFIAESFYDAGVRIFNSFTDPLHREFWQDPDAREVARGYFVGESKYERGQEILQDSGTFIAFCGFAILGVGTVVTMGRPSKREGTDVNEVSEGDE